MTNYGCALTLAAIALEALSGEPMQLYWCVDLVREVPPDPPDAWAGLLERLKRRLDAHPSTGPTCRLGLMVRSALTDHREVASAWRVPQRVDIAFIAPAPPPVGHWLLWPQPPAVCDRRGVASGHYEGEVPSTFWEDGVPF